MFLRRGQAIQNKMKTKVGAEEMDDIFCKIEVI